MDRLIDVTPPDGARATTRDGDAPLPGDEVHELHGEDASTE